ncbi:MAG TPA: PilZ domain-containing protein [Steroidobacteraceae bacterium]|nr:PilZ domain-containing protein [Steroidobacteraceae bacterium]HRX90172.1 PilZ domain-containing protein [Steroidobacteraceae bacterium]
MTFDGRDTIVLFDELAYEDVLSLAWQPRAANFDELVAERLADNNIRLLQAFDALEEHSTVDKPDEASPYATDLARMDFKINLLLDLVGQLLAASHARPRAVPVRFNALGASWQVADDAAAPDVGSKGLLQIYLRDTLVQPLTLPARVSTIAPGGQVRVHFELLNELVADHLEKLVFRHHRRKIAGARVAR